MRKSGGYMPSITDASREVRIAEMRRYIQNLFPPNPKMGSGPNPLCQVALSAFDNLMKGHVDAAVRGFNELDHRRESIYQRLYVYDLIREGAKLG